MVIRSSGETAVYLGDIAQHQAQLERSAWISSFDVLPLISLETKERLIRDAINHGHLLICVHNAFPGVGRLRKVEGRTTFQTEPAGP